MSRSRVPAPLIWFALALFGFLLANRIAPTQTALAEPQRDVYEELKIFSKVLGKVQDLYVEEVDVNKLMEGAIQGMLSTLDPHSAYLPPDMFKELQIDTQGSFGGLGIEINMTAGILRVIAPIDDTPAYRAGIKAGDRIVKIDGEETKDISIMEAVKRMRGPKGTDVTLSIFRSGFDDLKDFTITRDIINIKSIREPHLVEGNYAFVRISNFQQDTAEKLEEALDQLSADAPDKRLDGLILDLRNNPGGLLSQSVAVADLFVEEGLVVYTQGRTEGTKEQFFARRKAYEDVPLAVLVNGGSASASEIVAGAVQDHKRGVILGTQTFGKASVQHIIPLEDRSNDPDHSGAIKLTIARYYTPSGRSIQETGITPDIVIDENEWLYSEEEERFQSIREKDLKGHLLNDQAPAEEEEAQPDYMKPLEGDEELSKDMKRKDAEDYLLQRGLEILKGWKILSRNGTKP